MTPATTNIDHQLTYCRNVHQQTLDWYKSAETKAQIIVPINGLFITFLGSSALLQKNAPCNPAFPVLWKALIVLTFAGITCSVFFAVLCLVSRLSKSNGRRKFSPADKKDLTKYSSDMLFFFEGVKQFDPKLFAEKMLGLTPQKEIEILSYDTVALAKNVSRKHRCINCSFGALGCSLLLFVILVLSNTLR